MKIEDYFKYYIQGSDHYLMPKDVFDELFDEMSSWKEDAIKYKEVIDKIKKYTEPLITNRDNLQCYPISWYSKDVLLQILKEVE